MIANHLDKGWLGIAFLIEASTQEHALADATSTIAHVVRQRTVELLLLEKCDDLVDEVARRRNSIATKNIPRMTIHVDNPADQVGAEIISLFPDRDAD